MRVMTTLGFFILCLSLGTSERDAGSQAVTHPIVGVWVLNEDLSDEPPRSFGSRPERGRGAGRGRGGFGGGRGGSGGRRGGFGGGRGAERPDPEAMAAAREAMQAAMEDLTTAARRMTIVIDDDDEVLLTYGDGRAIRLIPDDREHAGLAGNAMQVTRRTTWQGDRLVTQIDLQARETFRVHQTYDIDPERQLLVVTSRFEGDRFEDEEHPTLRRVYERDVY